MSRMELEKKAILSNVVGRSGGSDDKDESGGAGNGCYKSGCVESGGGGGGGGGGDKGASRHAGGRGLSVLGASWFLIGELAGTGVMSIPHAMNATGYSGIVIIILCLIVSCYTGHLTGQCWLIVQARCPEFRGHVRHPYPTIAYVAYGNKGRIVLSIISNFSMLGSSVVFLIMASQNVHRLITQLTDVDVPFCLLQIVVVAFLTPLNWFGTPKDFRWVAVGAVMSTIIAVSLSLVVIAQDSKGLDLDNVRHSKPDFLGFFQATAMILFATCGHYAFPTFQNDMTQPEKLGHSLILSYSVMGVMYIPVAVVSYLVYGNSVGTNLLLTLNTGPVTYVIIVLVTCHLVCGIVIVVNPCMQHFDESLGISKAFTWRRVLSRTAVMLFILFVAETVPKFGAIMSLVGGSSNLFMMLIAPVVFYIRLCSMAGEWPKIFVPLHIKAICVEILAVGTFIGVMSTYGSIVTLWGSSSFTVPCFVDVNAPGGG